MLEQKTKGRARVKIAVFLVLAIHGIGLLALLMQGCKKEPDTSTAALSDQATNTAPTLDETNLPVADTNPPAVSATPPTAVASAPPSTAAAVVTDYKIAQGDTFSTIAKKFHVSVKAIEDANPGVEPTKLKIGQAIHIPAPTVAAATPSTVSGVTDTTSSAQTYVVKSGDSLSKIAGEFGVTVKALRSANSLTTDKIVVGQKLKVPVKATATGAAGDTTSSTAATSNPSTAPSGK